MEIRRDEAGRPELTQLGEDGFVDCVFRIAEATEDASSHVLRLEASHEGAVVGFTAFVRKGIQGGIDREMEVLPDRVYRPAVRFARSGPESDALLSVLARLYDQPPGSRRMAEETPLTGIVLHQGDVDFAGMPVRIKLFGPDSDAAIARGDYFESSLEVDLPAGLVFWNEKDSEYREAILRGLSA